MKKAIIFDMDGLMFDSERATYEGYVEICREYGYGMRMEFYKKLLGCPLPTARKYLREEYGEAFPMEETIGKVHEYLETRFAAEGVPKKKGLTEILEYAREAGFSCLVATSSGRDRVDGILRMAGVTDYFADVICGNEVQRGKPHPDIFLKGCEKLCCAPGEAWVLEDSEVGVAAAYEAGISCICVPDMKEPSKECREKAAYVVDSLLEAMEIIRKEKELEKDDL
ncbi:MAG: HAD family hydrolase [Blautia sp.]|jgi:HAD superfamily hydrolase (TIGR01509 family)